MSTVSGAYYGGIVKNGLILDLDAAKIDSYPKAGTAWNDISGNKNNATLVNGPTFNSTNGGNIVLDGANDYIDLTTLPQQIFSTTSPYTLSFWLKTNLPSTYTILMNVADTGYGGGRVFSVFKSGGAMIFYSDLYYAPGNTASTGVTMTSYINAICNVTYVWNGSYTDIYVNGQYLTPLNQSQITGGPYTGLNYSPVRVGADNAIANPCFAGNIYTTTLYSRNLTSGEILQNYNALKGRYGL
jgi:hypothetical protein